MVTAQGTFARPVRLFVSLRPARAVLSIALACASAISAAACQAVAVTEVPNGDARPGSASNASPVNGFQGIYEFASPNPSDATSPELAGAVLNFYWSEVEQVKGEIDWDAIDNAIAPWAAAGKKVILRFSSAGEASWGQQAANATPAWVYADGVRSVTEVDGAVLPVYWDAGYLEDYKEFVSLLAQRLDGDPEVAFVEDGVGDGGELLPDTYTANPGRYQLWDAAGYSDALWYSTVQRLIGDYTASFSHTPTVPMVDSTFLGPTSWSYYQRLMAWLERPGAASWLQYNGLTSTSGLPLPSEWLRAPVLATEQREPTSQSGDRLAADCAHGVSSLHAKYLLIYTSDIDNPVLALQLSYCASL
ncbi:MAG TPA: hypothetical protein VL984_16490 [Acidimicrobiales bacterium]|nr:hypothetical protein [Acidimicrobiales bacterium]